MVNDKLYSFKTNTLAKAKTTLETIASWQTNSSGKIQGVVANMEKVHNDLELICSTTNDLLKLRDLLAEYAPLVEILEEAYPDIMSALKDAINTFATPMEEALTIVEQVRDVVGLLTDTAKQATSFGGIKGELITKINGACACNRPKVDCFRVT